jgi:HlyD family secretion protein
MTDFYVAPPLASPVIPDRPAARAPILAGLAIVALFFGGFGGWAAWAPLSSAAVAPGQVRVDSHRKTVQHLEGGIIREILVREGDEVRAGQVLIRLDDTQPGATSDALSGQYDALRALEARLIAERDWLPAIDFPPILAQRRGNPAIQAMLAGQETIFSSRRRALDGQLGILKQRIEQLRSEIAGYRAQVASLEMQSALIKTEIQGAEELAHKGLERKTRLLELQREAANLEGNRGQQLNLIARAEQGIGETEMQMVDLANKLSNEVVAELRDTQTKLAEIEEKLRAALDVKGRTEIVAPQSGLIVNLRHFTSGGVLKAGEPVLDVVPQDDKLIIEAEVRPLDIEAVHAELPAEVRLTAYKQRRTPTVSGTVVHVSADSLLNERTGQPYYVAHVEIAPEQLARLEGVKLYPGMPAEVMIVTGKRTALEYLLDPVRDSFARAFREK